MLPNESFDAPIETFAPSGPSAQNVAGLQAPTYFRRTQLPTGGLYPALDAMIHCSLKELPCLMPISPSASTLPQ